MAASKVSVTSGVAVADECATKYKELKLEHNMKWIVFNMNDSKTEIVVLQTGDHTSSYEDFRKEMPSDACRYGIVDFDFKHPKGGKGNKIIFLAWSPDNCGIREKMLYASSIDKLKTKLEGGWSAEVQASDADDLEFESVNEKVCRV